MEFTKRTVGGERLEILEKPGSAGRYADWKVSHFSCIWLKTKVYANSDLMVEPGT